MARGLFCSVLFYYWNTLPLEYFTTEISYYWNILLLGYFFITVGFSVCTDVSAVGNVLSHPIILANPNLGHSI